MAHLTADEVRREHEATMGAALGAEFHRLYNEVLWPHLKWRDYETLFGTSPSRIDLLNSAAGGFFVLVNDSMWDDLILHVCRLTDQPTTEGRGKMERLSILRLSGQVDESLRDKVRGRVPKAIKVTKFARDQRDRRIAHQDLGLALRSGAKPLAPASRKKMGEAIDALGAVLAAVEGYSARGYWALAKRP